MPHLMEPFTQKSMQLRNRIVMSPMCMYSAGPDGIPNDFHLVHLGTRAMGGVGLIITEVVSVQARGRISEGDLGLWNDRQADGFKPIVDFVHKHGAKFGMQIGHAGRKAWSASKAFGPLKPIAPSAIAYKDDWNMPAELDLASIDQLVADFRAAAARARDVGCDMVEIHAAHGYLLNEFLSPLSNHRTDEYGGSLSNRARLLKRIYAAMREEFPENLPIWVRISASEWVEGGLDIQQSTELGKMLKEWGVDLVDCSSGGNSPLQKITTLGPGYQVPFAEQIRREAGIATGAVGLITTPQQADEILTSGKADVIILGRELLRDPYFPLRAAHELGQEIKWPWQYERGQFA